MSVNYWQERVARKEIPPYRPSLTIDTQMWRQLRMSTSNTTTGEFELYTCFSSPNQQWIFFDRYSHATIDKESGEAVV